MLVGELVLLPIAELTASLLPKKRKEEEEVKIQEFSFFICQL